MRTGSFPGLIIVSLAVFIGSLIFLGFAKLAIALLAFVVILLYLRKVENLLLFWLLTFALVSIDPMAILKVETHPILTYDRVFIMILLCIFLTEIAFKKRKLISMNGIEIIFILLLLVIGFSIAGKTVNKLTGIRIFIDSFLLPFIIYFLSKNCISEKKNIIKFANIIFIVGIYISLMGVYEFFSGQDLFPDHVYGGLRTINVNWFRVNGPFIRDYMLGFFCSICFFIALYKYIISDKRNIFLNIFHISMLVLITFSMFLTFFRGICLAWAVGLLTWYLVRRKGLIILNGFIIAIVLFIIPFVNDIRSSGIYNERIANVENVQFRFERYNISLSFFKENPILGIGFSNFNEFTGTKGGQHNQILTMLSETGIIGTSLYILLLKFRTPEMA